MKIFAVLFITLSFGIAANAQENKKIDDDHEDFFKFGVKGGLNVNKIQGKSYKDGYNFNYQVGAFLQFNFSRTFGIQPEVSLVQSQSEFTDDNSNVYNDLFRDGTQKNAKLNYLEVPILLNVNVGPSKRVKLQLGPSFGSLLKETVDSLNSGSKIPFKKTDMSVIGGVWLQLPLINLGGRYKYGLTNINDGDMKDPWHNQAFQFFIGITL